jgi:hypothetical protein
MQTNSGSNIFSDWLIWNFYEMPNFLLGVWQNYILFALNYFSLPQLLKSLFSPWKKYKWGYPKGFDIIEFLNTFISNIFSRIMGAVMRIFLIVVGIIFQLFVLVAGAIVFLSWILFPALIILAFLFVLFL